MFLRVCRDRNIQRNPAFYGFFLHFLARGQRLVFRLRVPVPIVVADNANQS